MVYETIHDGFIHIIIENDFIRASFLPEIGGKMIELRNKESGTQFLLETEDAVYEKSNFAHQFEDYDLSGFDDCFPTVSSTEYHTRYGAEIYLPDHGELWSKKWDYSYNSHELSLSSEGTLFDYAFKKTIHLEDNKLIIEYTLKNRSYNDYDYIWSAHPLLAVTQGSQLILPDSVDEVLLNWFSKHDLSGFDEKLPWPELNSNKKIDYSVVQSSNLGDAVKCYTNKLEKGYCAYLTDKKEALLFEFDPQKVPYVGIWITYGGWPVYEENKHYTIALEPCTGRPDALKDAVARNEAAFIHSQDEVHWDLCLSLENNSSVESIKQRYEL